MRTSPTASPAWSGGVCRRRRPIASAAELLGALDVADTTASGPAPHATWWRIHQIAIVLLYIAAAIFGWQIKEWIETPVTVSIFLALGAAATVGGVLRGHLVFTSVINDSRLATERGRTRRPMRGIDVLTALLLFALALGLGIALASLVLEPATTAAAFGDEP